MTNWREQALIRAGIDYNSIKDRFPKLVYGTCTGYGISGLTRTCPDTT